MGDSIFDNAAYTEGGPDVVTQLNAALPAGWAASLLAVDGSTTDDVAGQVGCLPSDASHLVLSASQWTPDWMPREIEVDTWACLNEASCGPMATARRTHPDAVLAVH